MRGLKAGFAALVLGASVLAGCSQEGSAAKEVEALVTKLTTESFKGEATSAVSLDPVRAALPADVALTWGSSTFEASTGATLLTNVRVTPANMPDVGVQIAELRLWDFNADLVAARLKGQRLGEAGLLARRIDAKGVQLFGLAGTLNSLNDATMRSVLREFSIEELPPPPAAEPAPAEPVPAEPEAPPTDVPPPQVVMPAAPADIVSTYSAKFDRYDFSIGRIVFDNVNLRAFESAAPKPAADPYDSGAMMMAMIQPYAAVSRSFTVDAYGMLDVKMDLAIQQMGASMTGQMGMASMGGKGWRGGDLDASFMRGFYYTAKQGGQPQYGIPAMDMEMRGEFMSMENIRLDKLYTHLARGELPPRTEIDALSLGTMRYEKQSMSMMGKELFTVAEATFTADKFHWLIPTNIKSSAKDVAIDLAGFMELGQRYATLASPGDAQFAPPQPDIAQVLASLKKNGLEKVTSDFDFSWNWNAASGDAKLELKGNADNFMDASATYEGGFPSFDAVSALVPDNGPANTEALSSLFDAKTTLKLVDINLNDRGGLEKLFGVTADMAKLSGQAPAGMDDPKAIRQMASMGVQMLAMQVPDMASFVTPIGNFIETGGRLHIAMKPPQPMAFAQVAASFYGMGAPGEAMKRLGVTVEHNK
jgi:hypothetical protein